MPVRSFEARRRRAATVGARASATAINLPPKCSLCGRPTERAAAHGLAVFHCRACQEKFRRHGHHWRKSYRRQELAPYLKAATSWLRLNGSDPWVKRDITGIRALLDTSGLAEPATSLRGRSPKERARIA